MTNPVATAPAAHAGESASGPHSRPPVAAPTSWGVLAAGVIGLLSSLTLTAEKVELLRNPSYVPSCNLNPIMSCGSVMATPESSIMGVPNTLLGIVGFTVVVVTGVLAVAKVFLPQWYWVALTIGILGGAAFVHWLIFQSLYRVGALCPYCMLVWAVTVSLLVMLAGIVVRPALGNSGSAPRLLYQWRWSIVALWFTTVFLLIVVRFWDYWSTLL